MPVMTKARPTWVLWAFAGIGGFFLVTEHGAHLLGAWPFLFLLACPFLHLFGHGKHGAHGASPGHHQGEHDDAGAPRPRGSQ